MPVMNEENMIREEAAAYEDRGDNLSGEGAKPAEGEGEGAKPAEGEGEGAKPAEGEGEGEGEGAKPAEGEGEGEGAKPAEGEGEGEGAKPAEGDDKQQPGPGWVPRHRYNSQARRARELEQRVQQLEQGQQPTGEQPAGEQPAAQPTGSEGVQQQLTEVNGKITQAIRDGSAEGLDDLYKQQVELQAQYAREVAQEAAQSTTRSTNDESAYDRRVTEVEQEYPQLNPDDENTYDDNLAARVETLRNAYVSQGYSMTDALDEALTTLEPLLTPAQQAATAASSEGDGGRTQEALRRNAEAATAQPAPADGGSASDSHGHSANGPDVASMTEEEFDALPEETKKRARGDDF